MTQDARNGAVKKLREKTGAGTLQCKKALEKFDGHEDAAAMYLRRRGVAIHLRTGESVDQWAERTARAEYGLDSTGGTTLTFGQAMNLVDDICRAADTLAAGPAPGHLSAQNAAQRRKRAKMDGLRRAVRILEQVREESPLMSLPTEPNTHIINLEQWKDAKLPPITTGAKATVSLEFRGYQYVCAGTITGAETLDNGTVQVRVSRYGELSGAPSGK